MPKLAKQIKVERKRDYCEITINGQPFPWHITEDGISMDVGCPPTLTLTLIAEDVQVGNALSQ